MLQMPPSAWRKARDLISSSANLVVDVMMRAIPRYCAICALLNQFCSFLSTNTLISLRLNSFDLLPLETFNKEDVFIWVKKKIASGQQTQKSRYSCTQFFCLFFLIFWHAPTPPAWWVPSNTHYFFFYLCFLCLTFLITLVPLNNLVFLIKIIVIMPYFYLLLWNQFWVLRWSGTNSNNHGNSLTALIHIW